MAHDYTELFQTQRQQFLHRTRFQTVAERRQKLKDMKVWIRKNQDEIISSVNADFGKSPEEIKFGEIKPVLGEIDDALENMRKWMSPKKVDTPLFLVGTQGEVKIEPKGVVLVVAPWNFPFQLTIGPVVSAIAAGNCVTIKPSELTPNTEKLLVRMIADLYKPEEVTVVTGDAEVGAALLEQPWNHIFFTGSPQVGKIVMNAAAKHLTSVTLELGGKNPAFVDETANLKDAAEKLLWGKCFNAGQSCISINYVLVHESKYDSLIEELRKAKDKLFSNDAAKMQADKAFARIVNDRHYKRIKHLLDESVKQGAEVVIGGETDESENYIAPTVLGNVTPETEIFKDEIFGPILPIIKYSDIDQALELVNSEEIPLALYIFTRSHKFSDKILSSTSAGTTCINETTVQFIHPDLPFGGHNFSGIGKAHGYYGFIAFSNERAVLKQKVGVTTAKMIYPPYTSLKKKMIDILTWKL